MPIPLNKILFISFDHIGDILRFTPLLRTLRIQYPQAQITCLIPDTQSAVLERYPFIDAVITFPHAAVREKLKEGESLSSVVDYYGYRLIMMLRRMEFDLVINPFMELGAIIAGLIRPKQVLGRVMTQWGVYKLFGEHAAKFYHLMSRHNELRVQNTMRFSDIALTILKDLAIPEEAFWRKPELYLGDDDRHFAEKFLADGKLEGQPFRIGFQMGAMLKKERFWPFEKFAELARYVHATYGIRPVLFGSPQERIAIERDFMPCAGIPCVVAAGETTLLQAGALLEKMQLLVSNDTGPMHMAAALGTPVVALFGQLTCIVNEARPWGEQHTVIVGRETKDIEVAAVIAAVEKYLKDNRERKITHEAHYALNSGNQRSRE